MKKDVGVRLNKIIQTAKKEIIMCVNRINVREK